MWFAAMDKPAELRPARIVTLGCRLNQADSALLTDRLLKMGFYVQSDNTAEAPELVIVNSCAVTAAAAAKSRQAARKMQLLYPQAKIVFTGCAAEVDSDNIANEEWLKLGNVQKKSFAQIVKGDFQPEVIRSIDVAADNFEENAHGLFPHRTRAFIKIQEGCDNFCTYCIVPYTRGPSRSRRFDEVVADCRQAVANGVPEIVLTGVNSCNYLDNGKTLCDLIDTLCNDIPGAWRLRLSSTEPALDNLALLETMARYPGKVCRFLHLALQHGCDSVLERMNRHYTTQDFEVFVNTARKLIPDIHLGTDIIAGFPGESDEEFEISYNFVKKMQFANLHVFTYSKRKGTPAAVMKNQVPDNIKKLRHKRLEELGEVMKNDFAAGLQGKTLPVIFETVDKKLIAHGWSDNYVAVSAPAEEVKLACLCDFKY